MRSSKIPVSDKYPWILVWKEVKEVYTSTTIEEIIEELLDVYTMFCICIYKNVGIDIHIIPNRSLKKFLYRIEIWKTVLEGYGLKFDVNCLSNGSNYKRVEKIKKVIAYYNL